MSHRPYTRLASLALLAAISVPVMALEPFTAQYQANYLGMAANAQMQLASSGADRWNFSLNIKSSIGDHSRATTFEKAGEALRPLSMSEQTRIAFKKKATQAAFNWNTNKATWSGDVKPERAGPVALKSGDTNALLVDLQLVHDIQAGKPLNYRTIDNGRAKQMKFVVNGKESIHAGGKAQQATKATYTDGDKQIVVWVADNVPVPLRILQRDEGKDEIDLKLTSWN